MAAAAIKGINARIRANPVSDYFCSTRTLFPILFLAWETAHIPNRPDSTELGDHFADWENEPDFWGPASNFGIPIAAILDTQKDPEIISGRMTVALTVYAGTFMRYALAVTPKNYLLFACHFVNFGAQTTQGYRYMQYWNYGGREAQLAARAKGEAKAAGAEGKNIAADAAAGAQDIASQVKQKALQAKDKVTK